MFGLSVNLFLPFFLACVDSLFLGLLYTLVFFFGETVYSFVPVPSFSGAFHECSKRGSFHGTKH